MAQRTVITMVDDMDGTEGENISTVAFGLDGQVYEIDLSKLNAGTLREQLSDYIDHARKIGKVGPAKAMAKRGQSTRERSSDIRKWAKDHGKEIRDRGRIPEAIEAEYDARQAT
jgi:Lsr2